MKTGIFTSVSFALMSALIVHAQDSKLVGTWTSKSRKVSTGPGFYNPVTDRLIEPDLPGISYSFTADGWYEEAYYRTVANPANPKCPSAVMQWQHGVYSLPGDGSIVLTPIGVDGRSLTSSPCSYDSALYERYEQPEMISKYAVSTDAFHNVPKLQLYQFDGTPQMPLYQAYNPPQMLPTQTLNPTPVASATGKKAKREIDPQAIIQVDESTNKHILQDITQPFDANMLLYGGLVLITVGSAMVFWDFSSKRVRNAPIEIK